MRSKTKVISIVLSFSVFFVFVSCQKQKAEWKGTIKEVDGVTIVKNLKKPMYGEDVFSLEEELTIGEKENGKEPVFISIRSIRVDDEENIHVLDARAFQVKVFNKDGTHLRSIGKRGQGPGEIQLAQNMELVSGKEIMVYDLGNRRLSFFSLDGMLLNEVSTGKIPRLFRVIPNSRGELIGWIVLNLPEERVEELKIFNPSLEPISNVTVLKRKQSPRNLINILRPVFSYQVLKNNKIIWGIGSKYEINISDSNGKLEKTIIKDFNPIKITEGDKEYEIKTYFGDREIPSNYKIEFDEYYPAFHHLNYDDEGRIFARTYERKDKGGYFYDVFDSEGRYIVKIPLRIMPRVWKKNKLYTIEEDEDGLQMVKRYKVTWRY